MADPSAGGGPSPSAPLEWEDSEPSERQMNGFVLVFLVVIAFCMILSHQMGHKFKFKYLAEAGAVVLVGMLIGGIIMLSSHGRAQEWLSKSISPTVFFIGFLPPIIYHSGYNLKRKVFLYYFVPSILYAVVGTIITSLFVGLCLYGLGKTSVSYPLSLGEALAFGSLITSTDTVCILAIFERQQVEPLLFYLVFGESVFNDAVVLVLYRIFTSWIGQEITWASMGKAIGEFFLCFVGSIGIGFVFSCAAALLYKHIDLRHSVYEMGIYLLLAYIPYVFSGMIALSGIVTILFTGMFTRHYSHPNLSVEGQSRALFLFSLLSVLAETAIFLQLGLTVFSTHVKYIKPLFIFWTFLLIMIGRALNVYPISWVINRYTGIKVSRQIQHMVWYAGIRGAMAFACAKGFPDTNHNQPVVVATTMMVVLMTLFGFGTTTIPMLEYLGIQVGVPADDAVNLSDSQNRLLRLEEQYLKPFLTRRLALGTTDGDAHPHNMHGGSGGRGHSSPGPPDLAVMRGREGSYIENSYIDGLFHLNSSIADTGGGSGGGAGSVRSAGGVLRPTFAAVDESRSGGGFHGSSSSGKSPPGHRMPAGSPPTQQQEHIPRSNAVAEVEREDDGEPKANVV